MPQGATNTNPNQAPVGSILPDGTVNTNPVFGDSFQNLFPIVRAQGRVGDVSNAAQHAGTATPRDVLHLQALSNLYENLRNRGIDQGAINRQTSQINRQTQGGQRTTNAGFAQRGIQNSGLNDALQAAIGASGRGQVAGVEVAERSAAQDRDRQNIGQFLQLLGLRQDELALATGQFNSNRQRDDNQDAAVIAAIASIFACWVARAVYGADNPKWLLARHYMLNLAPDELRESYMKYGPELSVIVRSDERLRLALEPKFDAFVDAAVADLQ